MLSSFDFHAFDTFAARVHEHDDEAGPIIHAMLQHRSALEITDLTDAQAAQFLIDLQNLCFSIDDETLRREFEWYRTGQPWIRIAGDDEENSEASSAPQCGFVAYDSDGDGATARPPPSPSSLDGRGGESRIGADHELGATRKEADAMKGAPPPILVAPKPLALSQEADAVMGEPPPIPPLVAPKPLALSQDSFPATSEATTDLGLDLDTRIRNAMRTLKMENPEMRTSEMPGKLLDRFQLNATGSKVKKLAKSAYEGLCEERTDSGEGVSERKRRPPLSLDGSQTAEALDFARGGLAMAGIDLSDPQTLKGHTAEKLLACFEAAARGDHDKAAGLSLYWETSGEEPTAEQLDARTDFFREAPRGDVLRHIQYLRKGKRVDVQPKALEKLDKEFSAGS